LSPASVATPPDGSGVRPTPGARRPLPRVVAVLLTVAAVILTGGLAIVVVIPIWLQVYFRRHPETALRARLLRRIGFGLMACMTAFLGLFIVGETLTDEGWTGLGLVAAGGVPLALVLAVTWWRPERAVPILAVLIAGVIVLSVWAAISEAWRAFEDRNGPLRTVLVWAVGAARRLARPEADGSRRLDAPRTRCGTDGPRQWIPPGHRAAGYRHIRAGAHRPST